MPVKKAEAGEIIVITRLPIERVEVPILGLTPLIPHKWDEKTKRMLPGHPGGGLTQVEKKALKKPEEIAHSCVYWLEDGRAAMPATAFKAAMVGACRLYKTLPMTEAKQLFFVEGVSMGSDQFVPIEYEGEPILREDIARIDNGRSVDLRYRYAFYPWWAKLTVRFLTTNISAESIYNLVDASGSGGIGDWRPSSPKSSTGTFGTFRVMSAEEDAKYYG